jgi:hypothetical protein
MDNHGRHLTPQFILLARANNIVPFTFPVHLTHCMQPLDVGVFQSYKHWHNKAIQCALETLDFEYTILSFLRDLCEVQSKTFKRTTIQNAFTTSAMWPINCQKVVQKMAKYIKTLKSLLYLHFLLKHRVQLRSSDQSGLHYSQSLSTS